MRFFTERPALRWLAPLALVTVVAGAGLVATSATADPKLPPRTAEQLLVDLQQAKVDGLSGSVTQKANLGIPELPGASGSRSSEFNSLLSGNHQLRIWYAGQDKARIALLGTLGESDLVVNGSDVWTWSSESNEATHRTVDRSDRQRDEAKRARAQDLPKTPQEAAERFLAAVGPTTEVATNSSVEVAGRAAYELVLQPRDNRSLISQVKIAVDAEKKIALRVQAYGQGAEPVAEVGFTSIDFTVPDDGQFAFNPPPGTKLTKIEPEADSARKSAAEKMAEKKAAQARPQGADADTQVVGTGWTTVVVSKVGTDAQAQSGEFGALLDQLPKVSGAWGSGRVLAGTAFSVVLTDDGRMAVGSVRPEVLYDALKR